ncbi:MAG TPA: phenylacetate--CoA ligase family protein [Kiloniellaceae bacterium]|nr:phenylacetate--CoA ligase family protein [Kiloniellaceae bacterium]
MATTLAAERLEQQRWKLRPQWAQSKLHDGLVEREFLSPEQQRATEAHALRRVIAFAVAQVPHYQALFTRLGLTPESIRGVDDLPALPVLKRVDVQEHETALRARSLPKGHRLGRVTKTSGSTGQPVEVLHTAQSLGMFEVLKQRQMRWARFDPAGRIGLLRLPRALPKRPDGQPLREGETGRRDSWAAQVGPYFETGPLFALSMLSSLESQMDWLEEQRLDYLVGQAAELEHLALGLQDRSAPRSLKGVLSVAMSLTPEMQRRIERSFNAFVHENYGFNEVGIVATRCREGGRYHVNSEHCLVEIVDGDGQPCRAGERGHLVATALNNPAMPLIRYDSGDIAEAVEGPCPCGRSLPAFGALHGRYRRNVHLPAGTLEHWTTLRLALADLPEDLSRPLRQYQAHQSRDGRFELRLVTAGPMPAAFFERIEADWAAGCAPAPPPLTIRVVDEIPRPPGGKFRDFTSDFELAGEAAGRDRN